MIPRYERDMYIEPNSEDTITYIRTRCHTHQLAELEA